jgi:hypothetical protein
LFQTDSRQFRMIHTIRDWTSLPMLSVTRSALRDACVERSWLALKQVSVIGMADHAIDRFDSLEW